MKKTMGQAIDEAIQRHAAIYPGSEVLVAEVRQSDRDDAYAVEIRAALFSCPLTYLVNINAIARCAS